MELQSCVAYKEGIPQAVESTIVFWQPRISKAMTAEDARQINENIAGYFSLLAAWDADRSSTEALQLINSKVTEISSVAFGATTEPEVLEQESTRCNPADSFLAA
jgi:hypothetical protein